MNSYFEAHRGQRHGLLAHWAWCLPALLVIALLSARQIDLYPPSADEFFSMFNSGWLVNQPYSPLEIVESLYTYSPAHTPGFFFALSAWGNITAFDVALGRTLGIYFGLLSLAVVYRLARDFVAPEAGVFAIAIFASTAFYNFYVAHVRMYGLLVFMSGVVLWLYLHIINRSKEIGPWHNVAFGVSICIYLSIHAYSAVFMLALGLFHLMLVRKSRRWWRVTVAGCVPALLLSPYAIFTLLRGMERYVSNWGEASVGAGDALAAWLTVMTNGQPLLLVLPLIGILLSLRRKSNRFRSPLMLLIFYMIVIGVLAQASQLVTTSGMRHLLPGILPFVLTAVFGFMELYSTRWWLGTLAVLWVMAGIWFQGAADWRTFIAGRNEPFVLPAWQVISRQAAKANSKPMVIVHDISRYELEWESYINYSQRNYYFDDTGVHLAYTNDLHKLELDLRNGSIDTSDIWIVARSSENRIPSDVEAVLDRLDYSLCNQEALGNSARIYKHSWSALDCRRAEVITRATSELISYQMLAASLDADQIHLKFVDEWTELNQSGRALDGVRLSYQLISQDWDNVAQLDLPLVHEGVPRRFSIDVSDVEPGDYRLVAILYDKETGERMDWFENDGASSKMLTLEHIAIPEG